MYIRRVDYKTAFMKIEAMARDRMFRFREAVEARIRFFVFLFTSLGLYVFTNLIYLVLWLFPRAFTCGLTNDLRIAQYLLPLARRINGLKIELIGEENLKIDDKSCIYIANHQSILDSLLLIDLINPNAKIVTKSSAFIFFFPCFIMHKIIGSISIDRSKSKQAIKLVNNQSHDLIQNKQASIFFFPEGTRNGDKRLLPFKKGPFHVAKRTHVPIRRFVVQHQKSVVDTKWCYYKPGTLKIEALPEVDLEHVDKLLPDELEVLCHWEMDKAYQLLH